MGRHRKFLATFGALAALPVAVASAQYSPPVPAAPKQAPLPAAQRPPVPAAQRPPAIPAQQPPAAAVQPPSAPVAEAPPVVLPPPMWDPRDAQQLLYYIQTIRSEGLDPADYDPISLTNALRSGNQLTLSQAATERFNLLSYDLAFGHVRGADRQDWHIPDNDLDTARQALLLQSALAQHRVVDALRGLLPSHPQYEALHHALEITPSTETDKINRIRLNMDRWRWLPRDLGERYIIVNVPAYTAALVEDGVTTSRHHAVAGKISTPTPQLSAVASGVILNPWWEVPKSIEGEVRGKAGYVPFKDPASGKILRWRQPPGPKNALGELKFVMPNPKAIYLHDTNARSKFNSQVRAFSHGCIRTEHILALATKLLNEPAMIDGTPGSVEWTPEKISATLASQKTVQANFPKPLPVYIVYMSSAALVDGTIKDYSDVYKRDARAIAALNDQPMQPAKPAAGKDVASR